MKPFLYGLIVFFFDLLGVQAQQLMLPPASQQLTQTSGRDLFVVQMATDQLGYLWASSGNGLVRFDGQQVHQFHDRHQPSGDRYNRVALAPDGRIWLRQSRVGLTGRLVYFDPATQQIVGLPDTCQLVRTWLNHYDLDGLFMDHRGQLWLGLTDAGLLRVNPKTLAATPIFREPITVQALAQGRDNIVWLGTPHGLYGIDPQTGQARYDRRDTTLSHPEITALRVRDNGEVLIGRYNEIDILTPATGQLRQIRLPLPTPTSQMWTNTFVADRLGNDYFSVGVMVFRLTPAGELQRLEFARPAEKVISIAIDRGQGTTSDRLWVNVAQRLDQYELSRLRPLPALNVLDVVVNGTRLIENEHNPEERFQRDSTGQAALTLQEGDFVQLRFAPFTALKNAHFRYKLDGFDQQWTAYTDRLGVATYQLPGGAYTFVFNRAGAGGWEKPPARIRIRVQPPFWKTTWFIVLILSGAGGLLGWVVRATRRRQKLRQELARRQGEAASLRQLDEFKTQFFANVTHEFRTPLTIILNASETLRGVSLAPREQERLKAIQRNAQQLLRLINDTLDIAKLDAGRLEATMRLGDPIDFLAGVVAQFRGLAEQKEIELVWDAGPPASAAGAGLYHFDDDKLEKIVYNLLANALKFTPRGGQVRVDAYMANASQLIVQIKDTGIGIAADQLSGIFERFHQVDARSTRAYSGTGIGLALVRELTEWLGGQVSIESEPGRGSTFTVALPLMADGLPPSTAAPIRLVPAWSDLAQPLDQLDLMPDGVHAPSTSTGAEGTDRVSRPLVLVVEDSAEMRAYIDEELAVTYQVIPAETGRQGLDLAIREVPDLIISDVMMPELDGYTLVERLKADERTSHIPVILLTAKSSYESRMKGLGAGADDYMSKPFSLAELTLRVGNCLHTRQNWQRRFLSQGSPGVYAPAVTKADPMADREAAFLDRLHQAVLGQLSSETLDVDWLADRAGMSRAQLGRKLTALTGLSPNRFIQRIRLERAMELLQTGEHSIAQVAYQVGFGSQSYFTKVFHEQYGQYPSQVKGPL